jgi:hypothetical protein
MTTENAVFRALSPAWYEAAISDFLLQSTDEIVGQLVRSSSDTVEGDQAAAWRAEISILRSALVGLSGHIVLEYEIPRMGARADAIAIVASSIIVLEFKVGATTFDRTAIEQVWDYALDLKNFHHGSHAARIVPILVGTNAAARPEWKYVVAPDGVIEPMCTNSADLTVVLRACNAKSVGRAIDPLLWLSSPYQPTPTIIEAARALYSTHSVEAISRHDAGATNLRVSSRRIDELIEQARRGGEKLIVLLTGVPGAGKTLVGLNVATHHRKDESSIPAVFLSGNGPLVKVLQAALIQDAKRRARLLDRERAPRGVSQAVRAFIQNVHHFRDEALRDIHNPPPEHVAIFDEAQRAWTLEKTRDFMRRRKGQPDFRDSEPAFLIRYLDRHRDWAVVLCLVGGGQEIHTGEAGIAEWLTAASKEFPEWRLCISSRLTDSEYAAGQAIEMVRARGNAFLDDSLHLAVSMRSFRAERVSALVKALLDRDGSSARALAEEVLTRFPIKITRDLDAAKKWVRMQARGSERFGLLASSKALRLKPHAVDVRTEVDPVKWFLEDRDDIRSSFYLEDCATEFQVQGLELDWTVVTWDADLRSTNGKWSYHDFRGKNWQVIHKEERRLYLKNAYRVLLTRARQGMVIFVPPGSTEDRTRPPRYYDETFTYLEDSGFPML